MITLSTRTTPVVFGKTEISVPYTCKRYKTVNKGDEDKVSSGTFQNDAGGSDTAD